jgi:hypothetical protein
VRALGLSYGKPGIATSYTNVTDGRSPDDIANLVVDATGVTTQQPEHVLTYTANGDEVFDLSIIVGEMVLPAGRPYKAVLEDWSTGTAIAHPNEGDHDPPGCAELPLSGYHPVREAGHGLRCSHRATCRS